MKAGLRSSSIDYEEHSSLALTKVITSECVPRLTRYEYPCQRLAARDTSSMTYPFLLNCAHHTIGFKRNEWQSILSKLERFAKESAVEREGSEAVWRTLPRTQEELDFWFSARTDEADGRSGVPIMVLYGYR